MQQIENPTKKVSLIFGLIGAVVLLGGLAAWGIGGNDSQMFGIIGLVIGGIVLAVVPFLYVAGNKQVHEIERLVAGENLLAHWTYSPQEWQRYTENEKARGVKEVRQGTVWTFAAILGMALLGGLITEGGLSGGYLAIATVAAAVFALLVGGALYLMARAADSSNRAGLGEVFIGGGAVYFCRKYYPWHSKWTTLEKITFEPGDPSIVEIRIRNGGGDQASMSVVRVPVPLGCEGEAQELVQSFYAAV